MSLQHAATHRNTLQHTPLHFGCGSRKSEANVIQVAKRAAFKFDLFVLHRVADFFSAHHGAFFRKALALCVYTYYAYIDT